MDRSIRFEMRLEPETLARVDDWRRSQEGTVPSRAAAVRRLLHAGLAAGQNDSQPNRLSYGERLIANMTAMIAQHLDVNGGIDFGFVSRALSEGNSWAVRARYPDTFQPEANNETVREVFDLLNMWRHVEGYFSTLMPGEQEEVRQRTGLLDDDYQFLGFHEEHEAEHFRITRSVMHDLNLFVNFKDRELGKHKPMLDRYRRMLEVYEPMWHAKGPKLGFMGVDWMVAFFSALQDPESS